MAINPSALSSSAVGLTKEPPNLREAIRDIGDQQTGSRRLAEKLVTFTTGGVDLIEVDQAHLRLSQADGTRLHFRIHPQGMEIDADTGLIYITTVEIIEERDKARRYWGKGRAHLFECNIEGETIRSANLKSDDVNEYHPSGMVLVDGTMFMALSVYAPESSATIIRFDVKRWTYKKLFHLQDHVGLVVPNLDKREIFLGNWGTRHYYCTDLKGNIRSKRPSPCLDGLEHQDAQLLNINMNVLNKSSRAPGDEVLWAHSAEMLMLATGVADGMQQFGLDIFDVTSWKLHASLRWPSNKYLTNGGWPPFANSTFLWVDSYDRVLALVTDERTDDDPRLVLYMLVPRT